MDTLTISPIHLTASDICGFLKFEITSQYQYIGLVKD
jgi:hypothetical protein